MNDKDLQNEDKKLTGKVACPVSGEVIPESDIPDVSFACGMFGPGVGIRPEEGIVEAPFDGKVSALFDTKHAIGLESEDGVQILIHVGVNTVKLKGAYMEAMVKAGDVVKAGQTLLKFDIEKICEAGYDTTVAVVVSNMYRFPHIEVKGYGRKAKMDELMECGE